MVYVIEKQGERRVFGEIRARRTKEQIFMDRKNRAKRDHMAMLLDKSLKKTEAVAKERVADKKAILKKKSAERKISGRKEEDVTLPVLEDMIPKLSLHKLTV